MKTHFFLSELQEEAEIKLGEEVEIKLGEDANIKLSEDVEYVPKYEGL